ncbi:hypothetical protein GIB67_015346 [Kingdonia uniflora]|uniref:Uncharacterized protein n=1 Tax=Kingdonia uniflora TaxID=39325 RepID=A0A7J7KYQ6_9MAGN|nr:hypothetical protein GIB67_015346 [Kingdonia uniflora]
MGSGSCLMGSTSKSQAMTTTTHIKSESDHRPVGDSSMHDNGSGRVGTHTTEGNGFQKLEKVKDLNRQTQQLEELTEKMRDCKRIDGLGLQLASRLGMKLGTGLMTTLRCRWEKPDPGWIMLNTNGTAMERNYGCEGIIKDDEGVGLGAFHASSTKSCELGLQIYAMLVGLLLCKEMGCQRIQLVSVSKLAVSMVQGNLSLPGGSEMMSTELEAWFESQKDFISGAFSKRHQQCCFVPVLTCSYFSDRKKKRKSKSSVDWWLDGLSGEFRSGRRNNQDWASEEIHKSGGVSSTPIVLLLVLISGRRPLQVTASPMSEFERASLISWLRHLSHRGKLQDLFDPTLQSMDQNQALLCTTIAFLCLQRSPVKRPSIKEVVGMLSGDSEPPHFPVEFSPSPPSNLFKSLKKARFKVLAGSLPLLPLSELRTAKEATTVESEGSGQEVEGEVHPDGAKHPIKPVGAGLTEAEELEKYIAVREEMYMKA